MDSNCLKVVIIGNSVALRVRPIEVNSQNYNYGQILENGCNKKLNTHIQVLNLSEGGAIVNDFLGNIDQLIRSYPDVYIINLGVVDASTREIPRWFFKIINNKKQGVIRSLLKAIYSGIIKRFRRQLTFLRLKTSWVGRRRFKNSLHNLIETLVKETNAKIITLAIHSGNQRIEHELPGSLKKYQEYSGIIKSVTQNNGGFFISINNMESSVFFPDGVHLSNIGHQYVADLISRVIVDINSTK